MAALGEIPPEASPMRRQLLLATPTDSQGIPPVSMDVDSDCFAGKLDETSLHAIFQHLSDPADLNAAGGVCREWHRVIIEGHSWRSLCNRLTASGRAPFSGGGVTGKGDRLNRTEIGKWFLSLKPDRQEAVLFHHLCRILSGRKVLGESEQGGEAFGPGERGSDSFGQGEPVLLQSFGWGVAVWNRWGVGVADSDAFGPGEYAPRDSLRRVNLITDAIAASTTDNYPLECISKTLKEHSRERTGNLLQACYWSSKGDSHANKDECLLYKLADPMCVVSGFYVRPFKAFFQPKQPVYSSAHVRFKLGHRKVPNPELGPMDMEIREIRLRNGERLEEHGRRRDKFREADYVWTYESPRYPMAQEDTLQRFDLPSPVLCLEGVLRVDLIGKVQRQEDFDNLYYTCITHVKAVGIPLPSFRCKQAPNGGRILEFCADPPLPTSIEVTCHAEADRALFVAELDSDEEDLEEGIWD